MNIMPPMSPFPYPIEGGQPKKTDCKCVNCEGRYVHCPCRWLLEELGVIDQEGNTIYRV